MNASWDPKLMLLSTRIFEAAKAEIFLSSRFFMLAIGYLKPIIPEDTALVGDTIGTDGNRIFYHPGWVIGEYGRNQPRFNRTLVHMALHCMFKHFMKRGGRMDPKAWDIACDIVIESIIDELDLKYMRIEGRSDRERVYSKYKNLTTFLNAEHLYPYMASLSELEAERYYLLFARDNHTLWLREKLPYMNPETDNDSQSSTNWNNSLDANSNTDDSDAQPDEGSDTMGDSDGSKQSSIQSRGLFGESLSSKDRLQQVWDDIASQVKLDLESFHQGIGKIAGDFLQMMKIELRRRYDYREFLKRFMSLKEIMKEDLDQFDYIYYSYGFRLYGNMPLIEFLEYKETNVIDDFVIIIDTSGSTMGPLVLRFLEQTYAIIENEESHNHRIHLHIIQADADLQEDRAIYTFPEFANYMGQFALKGGGGTDFRPAIEHVSRLVENKAFTRLKGVVYFTDGMGVYPEKRPDFDIAFVFYDNLYDDRDVPAWAIKLVIGEEELV